MILKYFWQSDQVKVSIGTQPDAAPSATASSVPPVRDPASIASVAVGSEALEGEVLDCRYHTAVLTLQSLIPTYEKNCGSLSEIFTVTKRL